VQQLARTNGEVETDDTLRAFLQLHEFVVDRRTLYARAGEQLTPAYRTVDADTQRMVIVKSRQLPRVELTVETRMGKKKVGQWWRRFSSIICGLVSLSAV
jgi:hypothetical protein